jgi:8-oxo-dGTP pyrophosphatase MutT (NUDIX family)
VIERVAARVVLLDREGRVLLFCGSDPARPQDGTWWITPGGGVEPGESLEQAARREVLEETGHALTADLGPVVLRRRIQFSFEGLEYEQSEHFFVANVDNFRIDHSRWTEIEHRTIHSHRWWTADELGRTDETVYPEALLDLLTRWANDD